MTQAGTLAFGSGQAPVGAVWIIVRSLSTGNLQEALRAFSTIVSTAVVFAVAVYAQAMKVEIPLSFGRVRGHGVRWPLSFLYTSNIPVILVAALAANFQLWARLMQGWTEGKTGVMTWLSQNIFGHFAGQLPVSGLARWFYPPNIINEIFSAVNSGSFNWPIFIQGAFYTLFMVVGAIVFSIFWVQTAGMDAKSQAKNILSSGLQIPGFRRDERVLEKILNRYIFPLTIMGAIAVGILAASADILGALTQGTGILLAVMIIYRLYEEVAQQHMMDMYPALRKMME